MILPQPPAWFVRQLRAINRHFSVRFDENRKMWAIMEAVRWNRQEAVLRSGTAVHRLRRRPEPALFFPELGSKVLEYVRRNDPRRFRNVEEMVQGLDLDDKKGLKMEAYRKQLWTPQPS